jgi:hypothetical protein
MAEGCRNLSPGSIDVSAKEIFPFPLRRGGAFFRARQVLFFPLPGKVGYLSEATAGHFSAPRFDASGLTGRTTLSDGDIPQILSLALDSNGGIRK